MPGAAGYLLALLLTLALEVPAYAVLLPWVLRLPRRRALQAGVAVNLVSHPLAFLVAAPLLAGRLGYWSELALLEAGVWAVEAVLLGLWLRRERLARVGVSYVANALSLAVGLLLLQ